MRIRPLFLVSLLLPVLSPAPDTNGSGAWEKPIAPGLVYRMEYDAVQPRLTHALRITPSSLALRWYPVLSGGTVDEAATVKGRLTPTDLAKQENALATVNGDFFSFDQGAPIGMTVSHGELLNSPARARSVFAWGPGVSKVGLGDAKASLDVGEDTPTPIDGVNQPISANGIGLYTAAQGRLVPRDGAIWALLDVPQVVWAPNTSVTATVVSVSSESTPFTVAPGRAVLVATGAKKLKLQRLTAGSRVGVKIDTPNFDWEKLENAIGGGPTLVKDGKVAVDAKAQGFNEAFSDRRHPRTAIGRTANEDVWIVAVDGRQETGDGATLDEMAATMLRLGCVDAINLDGGGSTALHVRSLTVNRPSDGKERAVSNGIVIQGPRPAGPLGKLKIKPVRSNRASGLFDFALEQDGIPVPQLDVLWTSRGAAWTDPGGRVHFTKPGSATLYADAYGQTVQLELDWKPK